MSIYIFGIFFTMAAALFCLVLAHQQRVHQRPSLSWYGLAVLLCISSFTLLVMVQPGHQYPHHQTQFVENVPPIHTRFTIGG